MRYNPLFLSFALYAFPLLDKFSHLLTLVFTHLCATSYTADLQQTRAFNVRQLINKYSLEKYDTGSSRVSGAFGLVWLSL